MIELSKNDISFTLLTSTPGIGKNLTARLIAENEDISRFDNVKQLVAYARKEPQVYELGSYKSKFSISKKEIRD